MIASASKIQDHISNKLPEIKQKWIAGIIGDKPSQGAKSPVLWNAAFKKLEWDAAFFPWDVETARLSDLLKAIREDSRVLGFSATMPHKVKVMEFLDALDPLAEQIGAVNCVVRQADGKLKGYNTDGQGALDSLSMVLPSLEGKKVVLLGYGGAACAAGFFIASVLKSSGKLTVCGRDPERSKVLAGRVHKAWGNADWTSEADLAQVLKEADLVVNATTKGQSGWRKNASGGSFSLEPYSALGPADPAVVKEEQWRSWYLASRADIERNFSSSNKLLESINPKALFFDLIYSPFETRFLSQGKLSGHPILNGKVMNIGQAADAFVRKVCKDRLEKEGRLDEAYSVVYNAMQEVW